MIATTGLRFVKRRVGPNIVRILQQLFKDDYSGKEEWRDVEMADERATAREIPKERS